MTQALSAPTAPREYTPPPKRKLPKAASTSSFQIEGPRIDSSASTHTYKRVSQEKIQMLAIVWYKVARDINKKIHAHEMSFDDMNPHAAKNLDSAFSLLEKLQASPIPQGDLRNSCLVARHNGIPSAIAVLTSRDESIRVEYLCSNPKYLVSAKVARVGEKFLAFIKDYAKSLGHSSVSLFSEISALNFYRKYKFKGTTNFLTCEITRGLTPKPLLTIGNPLPVGKVFIVSKKNYGRLMEDIAEKDEDDPTINRLYALRGSSASIIPLGIINEAKDFIAMTFIDVGNPDSLHMEEVINISCKPTLDHLFVTFAQDLATTAHRVAIFQEDSQIIKRNCAEKKTV